MIEEKDTSFENLMVGATNQKEQFLKVIIVFSCVVLGTTCVLDKVYIQFTLGIFAGFEQHRGKLHIT